MVGKGTKSKADAATDTVVSPSPLPYGTEEVPTAIDLVIRPELGAHSGERIIVAPAARGRETCLGRDEVVAYLGRGCPRELRARVEAHVAGCTPCQRWVRHLGDEILEYIGGQLSEDELARMDAHLDACNVCRDLVHHVVQGMAQSWHGEGHDAADPGTTFLPGNIVGGRYMILRFVGRGGMGEVYEAFDQLMDRRIALKTVLCTVADRPRAARRFKEEVRNAQRVGHPQVCRINDLQEHREAMFGSPLPFFTMEFIEGERLGNHLATGQLSIDDARQIALQLLGGLEAAHARAVLHLDFKSDNVMLRRDAEAAPDAVIMDFGLSRVLGKESRLRTSDRHQFAGTLPYMSVEQLECRETLGPATDVYAFGVVLYEMLTRTLPFDGESLGAVLLEQLEQRPQPPSHHVPRLSPAVDRFVLKCLQNNPRLRFADAGEALRALRSVPSWTRPSAMTRMRQSLPWAAGAIGLGIVAVSSIPREFPAPGPSSRAEPATTETRELRPPEPTPIALPTEPAPATTPALVPPPLETAPATAGPISTRVARNTSRSDHPAPLPRAAAAPAVTVSSDVAPAVRAREPQGDARVASTAGPSMPSPSMTMPTAGSATVSSVATNTDAARAASWKPLRVPKRLHVRATRGTEPPRTP